MSVSKSMYDEIVPFFGTPKAKLFVALNYTDGDHYDHAINEGNPEALLDEPLWQLMAAQNYKNGGREGWQPVLAPNTQADPLEVAGQFIEFVTNVASTHAAIDGVRPGTALPAAPGATRKDIRINSLQATSMGRAGNTSDELYQQIYTNFASLDESTRQFYSQFLNVVDIKENVVGQISAPNRGRLNLLKVDPRNNQSTVIFEQTLPLMPAGAFLVDNNGKMPLDGDGLRKLYREAYTGSGGIAGIYQRGGAGLADFYPEWAAGANGLDVPKFTAALVYATNKKVQAQSDNGVKGDFDGVYDLVTGKLYDVDSDGNLIKDGVIVDAKSYAAAIAAGNVNCYGTNLDNCDKVFECLLSGDSKRLGRCLAKLRSADMALVAGKEVKDMQPQIALKLLKTFGIELREEYGMKVPMEFLEWRATMESRVGHDAADAIKQNKKLVEYLRQIVHLVRANPAIIAENRQTMNSRKQQAAHSGVQPPRKFIAPSVRAVPASTMLLRTIPGMVQQISMPAPPMLPPGIAGFGYGPSASFPFGLLSGGAQSDLTETAQGLQNSFVKVLKDLQNSGKDLVDNDKKLIENAIKKVSKNEKQITHALNELSAFTKLSDTLKNGLPQALELKDIDGSSRLVSVSKNVSNLNTNVGSLARENQALITQLYNNVFKSLASLRLGVSSSNLVPASN